MGVVEGAEHDDHADVFEVGCFPEVVVVLDRSLTKNSKYIPINERLDLVGIDVVVGDVVELDPAVLVWG